MLYNIIYFTVKAVLRLLLVTLPAETFNRLCLLLPGSLIVYGLRYYGAKIGENVTLTPPIIFHNFSDKTKTPFANLTIGDDTYFGRNLFLDLKDSIMIEDRVTVAMGVTIITHTDVAQSPLKIVYFPSTQSPVLIRKGAYIGARVTILQGVEVGASSVVAAGALITRSVPDHAVYGGVPAREIKRLPF